MEKYTLQAQQRAEHGRAARRTAGTRIPAVVYGQDMEAQPLWIDAAAFARVFAQAGETGVIELSLDGAKNALPTIVRDVQYSPLKHTITHVDFYRVSMKEEVTADIPVVLHGEAPAAKLGGTIMQNVNTIEVRALPSDLPHEIAVDVASLETFDDSITVADITPPENVAIISDADMVVVSVAAPRVEEKEDVAAEGSTEETPAEEASTEESAA